MARRSTAALVAVGLLVALLVVASRFPVPYVRLWPGQTVNVLGKAAGKPIIQVQGRRTYPTNGDLRMTTVSEDNSDTRIDLVQALTAWIQPDVELMPHDALYPPTTSPQQDTSEGQAEMVNAQDTAVAAVLKKLGYHLSRFVQVTGVDPTGPSHHKLDPRDRIEALNGKAIHTAEDVFAALGAVKPHDEVAVTVRRGDKTRVVHVTTRAASDNPKQAQLGVFVGTGFHFPFQVHVGIDQRIIGPSAGLMIGLSVYDLLTPGSLTGGRNIAGTGTLGVDGKVGPIGGIRQKIVGARNSGAALFFVPPANCDEATPSPTDGIRLVRADTLQSAVQSLEAYAKNPDAQLPRCSGG